MSGDCQDMIIDRIEPIALRVPLSDEGCAARPPSGLEAMHLVLCRVTTRSGITGYGEALCYAAHVQRALVATIEDFVAPAFVGQSVVDRVELNLAFRRKATPLGRAGTNVNALAAVDIALWDIAGKRAGLPLSAIMGGARRREVPIMASLEKYDDAALLAARVDSACRQGVAAVKVHETDLAVIAAARSAAPGTPFVADLNNGRSLQELESEGARWRDLDLLWLEDPIWPPEDLLEQPAVAGIRFGVGGDLGSAEQFAFYARAPSVGVVQPDVCMLGGLSEAIRVVCLGAGGGPAIVPHTPFVGPAAVASLQLLSVLEEEACFAMVEAPATVDPCQVGITRWRRTLVVPDGPGLGADPDPKFLERYSVSR
jgi:L-alanine-DL-glutamate epimerase-like enolase superfamily enzyme